MSSKRTRPALVAAALSLTLAACGSTAQVTGSALAPTGGTDGLGGPLASAAPGSADPTVSATAPSASQADPGTSLSAPGAGGPASIPTSSTGTPASSGPVTTTAATGAGPGGPAPTGKGWDRTHVYIGVTTANDIATVGNTLGVKSINPGNLRQDAEAMVGYLNARGGIFGRQVVPAYFDVKTSDDSTTVGQAICTHFSQDVPVIGLINMTTNGDTPNFDACMAKAHVPVMAWVTDTGDDSFFSNLHGFYNNMPFPSWERIAKPFVQRLVAQKYFSPWDSTLGRAGTAPAKTGLILPDAPQGRQIAKLLVTQLAAAGHAPAAGDVFFYKGSQDIQAAELKLSTDRVTHVFGDEVLFLFMEEFETQHYRPRYALNSSNAPSLFLEGTVPNAQLAGAMGIGVAPTLDVFAGRDPGVAAVPGEALCNNIYSKAHVSYPPDQRYAATNMYGMCDGFRTLAAAAALSGGLTGDRIRDGIGLVGSHVAPSMTFANGFTAHDRGLPGAARDLHFDSGCACFRYGAKTYPL